jgi:hypothetical protein
VRAWQRFTGMKYTQALRLIKHPLAQGILGERISARRIIRVLSEHPALRDPVGGTDATSLGEFGLQRAGQHPLEVTAEADYLTIVLAAEVLRMFTPAPANSDAYSYGLKGDAERYMGETLGDFSYVSNGKLIWAAAALGLEVVESDPGTDDPNAYIGLDAQQVAYVRRMEASGEPRAHHHRPPGYLYLRSALEHYAATGATPARWDGADESALALTSPFHEWLIAQVDPAGARGEFGSVECLAYDYRAGVSDGDHRVAATGTDLLVILDELGIRDQPRIAAGRVVAEWMRASADEITLSTEPIDRDTYEHEGWGAGSGTVERLEYACACRQGKIVEEHDNIPGFRDHSVYLNCDECRSHWRLVDGTAVLEPIPVVSTP